MTQNADYAFDCGECGKRVNGTEYHPYLYCELVKLGHRNPEKYLRTYGIGRLPTPTTSSATSARGGAERQGDFGLPAAHNDSSGAPS